LKIMDLFIVPVSAVVFHKVTETIW
jgi:hypothetical protein